MTRTEKKSVSYLEHFLFSFTLSRLVPSFGIPSVSRITMSMLLSGRFPCSRAITSSDTAAKTASLMLVPRRKETHPSRGSSVWGCNTDDIYYRGWIILRTSSNSYLFGIFQGLGQVFLGGFHRFVLPKDIDRTKQNDVKVVLLVELLQDGHHRLSCLEERWDCQKCSACKKRELRLIPYLLNFDTTHRPTLVNHKHQVLWDAGKVGRSKEVHKVAVYYLWAGMTNIVDHPRIMNKPRKTLKTEKSWDVSRAQTWMSPRPASRFTSYLMIKSPSIIVPSQPGHFLCCSIVGEKEMCAWQRDTVTTHKVVDHWRASKFS